MNVELFGGPYDGILCELEIPSAGEIPSSLTFAAARAIVGWDVATISETTYHLESVSLDGARYAAVPFGCT